MILRLNKQQLLIITALSVFIAVSSILSYVGLIVPFQQQRQLLKSDLTAEQQLLTAANNRANMSTEQMIQSSVELQKKLPTKPFTEQFFLELEKAEVVSDSLILSMEFSQDENVILENPSDESEDSSVNGFNAEQSEQQQSEGKQMIKPTGLKKVTARVSVESKRYSDFLTFIKTIEQSSRISQIEGISLQGPQEATALAEVDTPTLQYQLIVSAFYYTGLEQLRKDILTIDIPESESKEDPFQTLINN